MFHLKKLNNKILPLTMNNMTGTFKEPLLYDSYIGQYRNLKAEWIFKMSVLIVIESTDLEYDLFINYANLFLFLYFVHAAAHLWKKKYIPLQEPDIFYQWVEFLKFLLPYPAK